MPTCKKRHYLVFGMLALTLTACSSPKAISSNMEGISLTFDGSKEELKEVTSQAMAECQRYGRLAVLKDTSEIDDEYIATFNCVKGST